MWKSIDDKSSRKAEAGVLWKASCLVVLQLGGPHQGALSWVHAATLPVGSAPKREAQGEMCGEGISGGRV